MKGQNLILLLAALHVMIFPSIKELRGFSLQPMEGYITELNIANLRLKWKNIPAMQSGGHKSQCSAFNR